MRSFVTSGIILVFILIQFLRAGEAVRTIDGDGSGYYAYLPAVFVYGTTDFSDVYQAEKGRHSLDYMAHYFHEEDGKLYNKYYLGTALMLLPFFLLAMLYSFIIGMPVDGYTILFQYAVSLAAALYAAAGIFAGRKLLESFGIKRDISLLAMLAVLFGTNLFHYSFLAPSHSHVYSFTAISLFLLSARRYFLNGNFASFRWAMVYLALVVLIRPGNGMVVLLLPFLAESTTVLWEKIKLILSKPMVLASGIALFILIAGLQPLYNFIQTGSLILYSYRDEGFVFNNPAFLSFLFSYRKGFFVYTPLMLLIVPGMVLFFQRSKFMFFSFLSFLLLLIFVLSSWWNWFFGDSFGMRAMVDYYSLLAIPIGLLLAQLFTLVKNIKWLYLLLFPFVLLNLFQTYQYYQGIIHPDSMTKEKYWYVFLKTAPAYRNVLGAFPEPVFRGMDETPLLSYFNDMESPSNLWTSNGVQESKESYSGHYLSEMSQSNIYSPTLVLEGSQLIETTKEVYVSVSLMFRELDWNAALQSVLVYAAENESNETVFYKTFKLKQMPDDIVDDWRNATFGFKVPAWNEALHQLKVYVWNQEQGLFQLDDFDIAFYTVK